MTASGSRIGDTVKSVSPPDGTQFGKMVPFGLKNTTNRLGITPAARASPECMASSKGNVKAAPAVRRTARREMTGRPVLMTIMAR